MAQVSNCAAEAHPARQAQAVGRAHHRAVQRHLAAQPAPATATHQIDFETCRLIRPAFYLETDMSDYQMHVHFKREPGLRDDIARVARAERRTGASLIRSVLVEGIRDRLRRLPAPDGL